MKAVRIFRYVLHEDVEAYEAGGWRVVPPGPVPHPTLDHYRELMEWRGDVETDAHPRA